MGKINFHVRSHRKSNPRPQGQSFKAQSTKPARQAEELKKQVFSTKGSLVQEVHHLPLMGPIRVRIPNLPILNLINKTLVFGAYAPSAQRQNVGAILRDYTLLDNLTNDAIA